METEKVVVVVKEEEKEEGRADVDETEAEADDRISNLPDHVLRHILSFATTYDAVQMSLVSERWRNMWVGIPVLNFQFKCLPFCHHLIGFLYTYLDLRLYGDRHRRHRHRRRRGGIMSSSCGDGLINNNNNITSFKLHIVDCVHFSDTRSIRRIDGWLRSTIQTCTLKELDLCFKSSSIGYGPYSIGYGPYGRYHFPHSLLHHNHTSAAKSLTVLKLQNVLLYETLPISLPSLTTLSLSLNENHRDCFLEVTTLQNLISGCPMLEDLHLSIFQFELYGSTTVDLTVCGATLKRLSLGSMEISGPCLEHLVLGLPFLERLTLNNCFGFGKFCLHSQSLRSFIFVDDGIHEATFVTPNLVYFSYEGRPFNIISMESPNDLLEAHLKLDNLFDFDCEWYDNMLLLLSNLNCSNKMTLYLTAAEGLLVPELTRNLWKTSPLPDLKHLKVKINNSFSKDSDLIDAFGLVCTFCGNS